MFRAETCFLCMTEYQKSGSGIRFRQERQYHLLHKEVLLLWGISQYQLIKDYGIDKAQLQRLRQNMVVKTIILNRLCQILDCRIEDIMEYVPDDK